MNEIQTLFEKNNALLSGHFLLSSGMHSDKYFQSALVLQYPAIARELGLKLASLIKASGIRIETAVSPALGGIIIGQETASALNARSIFTERNEGKMVLRRGFKVSEGERVLIVEDVITTGLSTREVIETVSESGANVLAVSALVDRSNGKAQFNIPKFSLLSLEVKTYTPQECPLCKSGSKAVKPGSRK